MPLPILPGPPIDDAAAAAIITTPPPDQGQGGSGPPIVYRPGQGQPGAGAAAAAGAPIQDLLRYGSPLHQQILGRLNSRRELSSRHIGKRYDSWDEVDEHCRMFIDLSRRAKRGDGSTDPTKAEMPFDRAIVMPMSLAILTVRLTQLLGIFGSREPMIQLEGRGPEDVRPAKIMEALLGYDLQQMSAYTTWYAFCQDSEKYGMGVIHDCWEVEQGWSMKSPQVPDQMKMMLDYMGLGGLLRPQPQWGITREYNRWEAVDPFHYWPDRRAPVSQVQQGEFVGHRIYRGMMHFKERAIDNGGDYFNLEFLPKAGGRGATRTGRNRFDIGDFQLREAPEGDDRGFYGLDTMQVKLIPADWKLGTGTRPEIWRFAWADEGVIVRASPTGYAHGQFSYAVGESVPDEHASFNPGNIENLEGIQRTINWLVNSHVDNVRKHLNDAIIFSPSLVEEADLLNPGPSRHVRLTALGEKMLQQGQLAITQMLMQLPWVDVTKGHLQTTNALFDMAQRLAATSDPQMSQTTDDERTLGEVQQVIAGSSARLAMTARMLDAQALQPLANRAISNRQQFTELSQYVRIAGDMAAEFGGADRLLIRPADLGGSFDYIPHSGTQPADPARLAGVWAKMLEAGAKIPQLYQPGPDGKVLDLREIFNEAAKAMGVKNVNQFYISVMPDPQLAAMVQAGNAVPMGAAQGGRVPGAGIQTPMIQGADLEQAPA
jgi:hypothetical protein